MDKSEEEQLLQDASTLLMFANVAAKHHHPPAQPQQQQQQPQQQPQSLLPSLLPSLLHSQPVAHPRSHSSVAQHPAHPQLVPSPSALQPQQPQTQFGHAHSHSHGRISPPGGYLTYPLVLSPSLPIHPQPIQEFSAPPNTAASTDSFPPIKTYYFPSQTQPSPSSSQPPSQVQPPKAKATSKAPMQETLQPQQTATVQGTAAPSLPPQTAFTSHKRSSSGFLRSPGPANIALPGGITESGKQRNSNNAIIAAAALADAASMPFPLLKKDDKNETEAEDETEDEEPITSSVSEKAPQQVQPQPEVSKVSEMVNEIPKQESPPTSFYDPTKPEVAPEAIVKVERSQDTENETEVEGETGARDVSHEHEAKEIATKEVRSKEEPKQGEPKDGESKLEATPNDAVVNNTIEKNNQDDISHPLGALVKAEFQAPQLASYQVDPDAGLIGCICGLDDDDGFTIQCDVCFRWQHCLCMNFKTNEEVPDEYKCYYCDKEKWGKFNADECRRNTLSRLESETEQQVSKKDLKRKSLTSEKPEKKRKTLESKKKDEGVTSGTLGSNNISNSGLGIDDKHKEDLSKSKTIELSVLANLPNKDNILLEGGMTSELYQGTYYKLRDNDYKTQEIRKKFDEFALQYNEHLRKENSTPTEIKVLSKNEFDHIKWSKIILPNFEKLNGPGLKKKLINNTQIQVKQYSENQKQKFNGISKLGLFISVLDNDKKVSPPAQSDDHDVVAKIPIGTPIIEYLGELSTFQQYIEDKTNQYGVWHTLKPKVCKMKLALSDETSIDIVSDSRFVGNESRFVRSACPLNANCVIKPILIKELNIFKFMIVTSKEIEFTDDFSEEELRLEWQWDEKHPIRYMYETESSTNGNGQTKNEAMKFEQFTDLEKAMLVSCTDTVMNFVECGCNTAPSSNNYNCSLFKLKKTTAYLLRPFRKGLNLSNMALSREILILNSKKPRKYISWQERMDERDKSISMSLLFTGEVDEFMEVEESEIVVDEDLKMQHVDEAHGQNPETSLNQPSNNNNINENEEEIENKEFELIDENTANGSIGVGNSTSHPPEEKKAMDYSRKVPYKTKLRNMLRSLLDIQFSSSKQPLNDSICVPVVPELIIQIQEEVSKKIAIPEIEDVLPLTEGTIKEVAKPDVIVAAEAIDTKNGTNPISVGVIASLPSSEAVQELASKVAEAVATAAPPPPVVKKLSFADYKKKMK